MPADITNQCVIPRSTSNWSVYADAKATKLNCCFATHLNHQSTWWKHGNNFRCRLTASLNCRFSYSAYCSSVAADLVLLSFGTYELRKHVVTEWQRKALSCLMLSQHCWCKNITGWVRQVILTHVRMPSSWNSHSISFISVFVLSTGGKVVIRFRPWHVEVRLIAAGVRGHWKKILPVAKAIKETDLCKKYCILGSPPPPHGLGVN